MPLIKIKSVLLSPNTEKINLNYCNTKIPNKVKPEYKTIYKNNFRKIKEHEILRYHLKCKHYFLFPVWLKL